VTSQGDGQDDIYLDDEDRECFLEVLSDVCERFNWVVHVYCLMRFVDKGKTQDLTLFFGNLKASPIYVALHYNATKGTKLFGLVN